MPQMPSTAARSEPVIGDDDALNAAVRALAHFGFFGLVWLGPDLMVRRRFGDLVSFVECNQPVTDSLPMLIGLEHDIGALRPDRDSVIELPAVAVVDGGSAAQKLNFTMLRHDGVEDTLLLVYRSNATTELEVELSRQIRARLMAESQVKEKSKELQRANADLEAFAAIVSHDLKAPLRHIQHVAEMAAGALEHDRQAALCRQLQEMSRMSARLSRMLAALFDYSSLGRKTEALEVVDTRDLVRGVTESLPVVGYDVVIEGSWPSLTTLRAPLDLVLRNLIANAVRHHDRATGRIAISARDEPSALHISVGDDGPGISPVHQEAIFLPFRTLTSHSETESTGMGLAMVKKTLDAVGGSIGVQSDPATERGATFDVSWPKFILP